MKWKITLKNRTITFEVRYTKQEQSKYFLAKYEFCKQAQNVGNLEKIKSKTIGIRYNNNRIKVATHQQNTINKRIE